MFSAELLSKRRRHYSSALVGRSIEMLFAVLARVSGDESVEFHLGTLKPYTILTVKTTEEKQRRKK